MGGWGLHGVVLCKEDTHYAWQIADDIEEAYSRRGLISDGWIDYGLERNHVWPLLLY